MSDKGIIEKLGITPIEGIPSGPFGIPVFDMDEVREVEQQRNEMLEALIDSVIESKEASYSDIPWRYFIQIIEKDTGKTWEEIKSLIGE